MKFIKIEFQRESKITKIPTSSNVFGLLINEILKKKDIYNNENIEDLFIKLQSESFAVSDLMPKGYIYNPNINYYINQPDEPFSNEKSTLQKKYKKNTYVKEEYFKEKYKIFDNKHYLKIYDEESKLKENFLKYSLNINQHVQINTVHENEDKKNQPMPFNTTTLEINEKYFECHIMCSDDIYALIKPVITNIKNIFSLGGGVGKGYNIFSIKNITEEEKELIKEGCYLSLSDFVPKKTDDLSLNKYSACLKIKNKSVRPVRKLKGANDMNRYRYFYIDHGSILNMKNIENIGDIFNYKDTEDKYCPKVMGKPYLYYIGKSGDTDA